MCAQDSRWIIPLPRSRGPGMDFAAVHQRIASIALAFAAGLLHRPVQPAPHIHLPAAPSCEVEDRPAPAGWPSWAVCLAIAFGYFLGSRCPPARVARGLLALLVRWADAASPEATSEPPALFRE